MLTIAQKYENEKAQIENCVEHFWQKGELLVKGRRNIIKIFDINESKINIKAFKKPNFINTIIYRYFRKSKARRSYEYANILLEKGIGTPEPVAFFERRTAFGLAQSFYVCRHLQYDLTYRELVETDYPDAENILRQFTRFTFDMHTKGIEFLDHSPGNTLIVNEGNGSYSFYLVDLNRMRFGTLNFETRMKNLSKITPHKEMVAVMSNEYAKLSGYPEADVFEAMWRDTERFQQKFHQKRKLKNRLKFWNKQ